jgi:hypothetical protein
MSQQPCPRCGTPTQELQNMDAGLVAKIRESGNQEQIPGQVCGNCFAQLAGSVARGSLLMVREKAKEQKKLMLWKSRVNLIKKARQSMQDKAYSESAVAYEKYIKVLEVVFEAKPGELSPEQFKDAARTQELTIVASVYWDLLRIYDTSERYGERQALAAKKLSQFLRFTPIFPDILRKAEAFQKTAKNPGVIKSFLKMSAESKGRCFVATAAFEYNSPEVELLQQFRDAYLLKSSAGKAFVFLYYKLSPPVARVLDKSPFLRPIVRFLLRQMLSFPPFSRLSASRHQP